MTTSTGKRFSLPRVMRALFVSSALLICALAQTAKADAIYTYTGQHFTYVGTYLPVTGVSGSFTVPTGLLPNKTYSLAPTSAGGIVTEYDFTDGYQHWYQSNYTTDPNSSFSVTTNASGNIVAWDLNIYKPSGVITTCTACAFDGQTYIPYDNTSLFYWYDGYNFNHAGTWTATGVAETPEPGSLMLFGSGLLGLVNVVRKRMK